MHRDNDRFSGWSVSEAIRYCTDPAQLSQWFSNRRRWKAGGARKRFIFLSEEIEGRDAFSHNGHERIAKAVRNQSDSSYIGLKRSLEKLLLAERLVAWGRYGSPVAPLICIPATAWDSLSILDVCKSTAQEALSKNKLFGLRIYPVVRSPDILDRLVDRTFIDAFRMTVINDPQIAVLNKRVAAVGGCPVEFGYVWEPYRAVWSVMHGQGNGEGAIGFLRKSQEPKKYNTEQAAGRVVSQRFAAMMRLLADGKLVAEGIPRGGGAAVTIPRSLWHRKDTYLDLGNGDVIECNSRADDHTTALSRPIFLGLMFQRPSVSTRSLEGQEARLEYEAPSLAKPAATVTKTTSRDACRLWLCKLMAESPMQRPKAKHEFWLEAQSKWPETLANRAFNKAWDDAIEISSAANWSAGGRPKKPSQQKSPHE